MTTYILLADSNPSLDQRQLQLDFPNMRLIHQETGKGAILAWQKAKPTIGFISWWLPDMTGFECIDKIRRLKRVTEGRLYLFSEVIPDRLATTAVKHGFAGCISTASENFQNSVSEILKKERVSIN